MPIWAIFALGASGLAAWGAKSALDSAGDTLKQVPKAEGSLNIILAITTVATVGTVAYQVVKKHG